MLERPQFESTISNEQTAQLPALIFGGKIVVVDSEGQIDEACRDLSSHKVIGFDTETRPSFKAGTSYKVSLLQLSTPDTCYLFRLHKIPFSSQIVDVLQSEHIIKLGADVAGDIRSLNQLKAIDDHGFVDLQRDIWEWGINEKSLRKMSAITLGHRISKAQRLSNWEAAVLTPQQQTYAATDAWACIEIYNKLNSTPKLSREQRDQILQQRAIDAAEAAARSAAKKAQRREAWMNHKTNKGGDSSDSNSTKPQKRRWRGRRSSQTSKTTTK